MNTKTNDELVMEIHEAFYSADERLLQEAKDLLANPKIDKALYAERLSKVGFAASKPVKDAIDMAEAHLKAGDTIKTVEYYRVHYPNNKYITAEEVKKICEKYGLLLGDASNYIGDVPEKNLGEIERFRLRKEDWTEKALSYGFGSFTMEMFSSLWSSQYLGIASAKSRRSGVLSDYYRRVNEGIGLITLPPTYADEQPKIDYGYSVGVDPYKKEEPSKETEQAAFKICAPKKDFNTAGYEVKDGHILVYDPVVLQPVKEGFLIVTAWGAEASDELVINHNQN
jgi:hypothetical protein